LYNKLGENSSNKGSVIGNEFDSICFEKKISIYAPCPCGSGKKIKDCQHKN